MAKDPVCGKQLDEKTAPAKSYHQGQTYYFCADACKRSFEKDPKKYIQQKPVGTHQR
jgi:YHS domain-containing protein